MLDPSQVTEPVSVKRYLGAGGRGDVHDPVPVSTLCQLDATRRVVTTAAGQEVVSEVILRLDPELDPALDLEALFRPESLVTVRGAESVVITCKPFLDVGQLVYVEVTLGAARGSTR